MTAPAPARHRSAPGLAPGAGLRKCDHQAVQSVFIIESESKDMRSADDVFDVVATDAPDEADLPSCEALGHKV